MLVASRAGCADGSDARSSLLDIEPVDSASDRSSATGQAPGFRASKRARCPASRPAELAVIAAAVGMKASYSTSSPLGVDRSTRPSSRSSTRFNARIRSAVASRAREGDAAGGRPASRRRSSCRRDRCSCAVEAITRFADCPGDSSARPAPSSVTLAQRDSILVVLRKPRQSTPNGRPGRDTGPAVRQSSRKAMNQGNESGRSLSPPGS